MKVNLIKGVSNDMNIFKQLYRSLFSPKDIATFRFQRIGKTIFYIFLLSFISIIPNTYYTTVAFLNGIEAAKYSLKNEIPSFKINNGILTSETNTPLTINKDNFTIIFDPTGVITTNKLSDSENTIALLKEEFTFITDGQTQHYSYNMFNGIQIEKQDLIDFVDGLNSMLGIILPVMLFLVYLLAAAIKFIEVSLLALFGIQFNGRTQRKLKYSHTWRIAAYSMTLSTVFFTIMASLETNVPNGFLLNWFISIIIFFLAIKEIPKPKQQ